VGESCLIDPFLLHRLWLRHFSDHLELKFSPRAVLERLSKLLDAEKGKVATRPHSSLHSLTLGVTALWRDISAPHVGGTT